MSEPTTKRKRPATGTAPKIGNADWDHHKQELTHLYVAENWTVNRISALMREKHEFLATEQQYQKKFRSWKLNKNIDEASWLVLSRVLKRYGITSDDLDGPHPKFEVLYNSQPLASSRVKKAIYRYDTSLLSIYTWFNSIEPKQTDKLNVILRNLITRCMLRNPNLFFEKQMGEGLVQLVLGAIYTNDLSEKLREQNTSWSLRHVSRDRQTAGLYLDEQLTFISSMLSISKGTSGAILFRDCDKAALTNEFLSLLQNCERQFTSFMPIHVRQQYAVLTYDRLLTDLLYFTLAMCILGSMRLGLVLLNASEVSQILSLSASISDPHSDHLLSILLWSVAYHGEPSLCAQLIAGGADPKGTVDFCICDNMNCRRSPHKALTILQMSLMPKSSPRPKLRQVVAILLEAGVDPNLCGRHSHTQTGHSTCCELSPVYLALGHSSTVFSALMNSGAHLPAQTDLVDAILHIEDPEILSMLLQRGMDPQIVRDPSPFHEHICPLQAVMAKGSISVAQELLRHIEDPLGCPPGNIAEMFNHYWTCQTSSEDWYGELALETPLAWALFHGWYHLADQLIKSGASLMESYLDYHSTSSLDHLKEYLASCSMGIIFEITSAAPLQLAVWEEESDAVKHILKAGVNPNHLYPLGFSPLTTALYIEHDDHISLLREWGAKVLLEDLRRLLDWQSSGVGEATVQTVLEIIQLLELSKQYYLEMNVDPDDLGLTVPEQYSSQAEKCVRSWRSMRT